MQNLMENLLKLAECKYLCPANLLTKLIDSITRTTTDLETLLFAMHTVRNATWWSQINVGTIANSLTAKWNICFRVCRKEYKKLFHIHQAMNHNLKFMMCPKLNWIGWNVTVVCWQMVSTVTFNHWCLAKLN